MQVEGLLLGGKKEDYRILGRFLTISVTCHIVFFLLLVLTSGTASYKRLSPGVINVNLVSLPKPAGNAASEGIETPVPEIKRKVEKKVTVPDRFPQKTSKKVSTVTKTKKAISTKKVKQSLKKKTFKPKKVVDNAIAQMKKKVEQTSSQQLQKTMERLADQVKKGEGMGKGSAGTGYAAGVGMQSSELLAIYAAEIYSNISKNWAFNEKFADGRKDLVALLGIRIMSDGEIRDVWFDRRSGNRYFDDQAQKAVLKTRYLPPFPEGFKKPFLEIGLRFTPSGLK
ncbi:MAG: TonB family protein [Desulfobacterales bacterium]